MRWLVKWFGCRHRDPLYDRVKGVAVWRCPQCMKVQERSQPTAAQRARRREA
jgi:hypothetical protein